MKTYKTVGLLPAGVSKEEEIAWLHRVKGLIADSNYLSALFSPAMLRWVEQMIHEDGWPDLFEFYCRASDAEDRLTKQVREITEEAQRAIASHTKALDVEREFRISVENRLDLAIGQIAEAKREMYSAQAALNDIANDLEEANRQIENLQAANARLKVRLYDLEHPE